MKPLLYSSYRMRHVQSRALSELVAKEPAAVTVAAIPNAAYLT